MEQIWAPLLAGLGVLIGWWLRRWSEESIRRAARNKSGTPAPAMGDGPTTEDRPEFRLSSRRAFFDDVRRRVSQYQRSPIPFSVLLFRFDAFDPHRESGLPIDFLAALPNVIGAVLRDMDHIAQYDERTLGVMLPGVIEENGSVVAQRLSQAMREFHLPLAEEKWTMSVAVAVTQVQPGEAAEDLLERAETTLDDKTRRPSTVECVVSSAS
jgi:GGDEF domain-containing protein